MFAMFLFFCFVSPLCFVKAKHTVLHEQFDPIQSFLWLKKERVLSILDQEEPVKSLLIKE